MKISVLVSCGKMCAVVAACESPGMSKSAVCVACIVSPFGMRTRRPFVVGCLLMQWLVMVRKWPVALVSAMPSVVFS